MPKDTLRLLHLSDIHFKNKNFDPFDDLRNELEIDAEKLIDQRDVDGILITGDIAFSGKKEEYYIALDWLDKLCKKIGCSFDSVWSIPGNHDVDRKVIDDSKIIKNIHQELRKDPEKLDFMIDEYMQDKEAREMMYRPINNYIQEFASKFNCEFDANKPYVQHNFTLNDGSILKIHGVNSTIVSYKDDNNAENKLVVGKFQSTISREDGVEYLLMCHHPYQWLLDEDARKDHWQNRARIHLFGHKHNQRLDQVNDSVVMTAGAMQPDNREPNWKPRYNFLEIKVVEGTQRTLNINVYSRVWKEEDQNFQPEFTESGKMYKEFNLPIQNWSKKDAKETPLEIKEKELTQDMPTISQVSTSADIARKLTYRFLRLPYHKRISIASQLDLLADEDKDIQDSELFQHFFRKAKDSNKLKELWEAVEKAHGDFEIKQNPYNE